MPKNPEAVRAYNKQYRALHHQALLEYDRKKYLRLTPDQIEKRRIHSRTYTPKYMASHPESVQKHKEWIAVHIDELREKNRIRNKLRRKLHPEIVHAQEREKNARRRAQKSGAQINDLSAAQWTEIKAAYGFRCVYCGRKMQRLTQDHIIPLSHGGDNTASNIVPACLSCNSKKGTRDPLRPVQPLLLTLAPRRENRDGNRLL